MNARAALYAATLLALALILAPPAARAGAGLAPAVRHALISAQKLMDQDRPGQAAEDLRTLLEATPDAPAEVYILLGGALYKAGDKARAADVFARGADAFPKHAALCRNAGLSLYETDRHAKAARYLERAYGLGEKPEPELLFQAGSALYLDKRFKAAARVMEKLLAAHEPARKEWVQLALHALLESGQTARAEAMLTQFLETDPARPEYWDLLAKLHLDRGRYAQAAAALEISRSLRPGESRNDRILASLYRHLAAPLRAAELLEPSAKADQAREVAGLYASAGRADQALRLLPGQSVTAGEILFRARRFQEAESRLAPLAGQPAALEARFLLGLCAWERRDWDAARRQLSAYARAKGAESKAVGFLAALEDLDQARKD